jgi:hypothetical protein
VTGSPALVPLTRTLPSQYAMPPMLRQRLLIGDHGELQLEARAGDAGSSRSDSAAGRGLTHWAMRLVSNSRTRSCANDRQLDDRPRRVSSRPSTMRIW